MSDHRYVVITLDDASMIATALRESGLGAKSEGIARIQARLLHDTGAHMQEIADALKATEICGACSIEGQASSCSAIHTHKLGRRLQRLLQRALGKPETTA